MKQYYLQVRSKNEKSLRNFLKFLLKHLKTKFNIFPTLLSNQNRKKIVTLLKSPHVNKSAQEHFGMHAFVKILLLESFNLKANSILLKKVLNSLFHDISINLKFIIHRTNEDNITVFYADNFKVFEINTIKWNKRRYLQKTKIKNFYNTKQFHANLLKFLNIISILGEILTLQLEADGIV